MRDPVAAAARALYESRGGTSAEKSSTRARILERARGRKRTRRRFALVLGPLAATLMVSTAWAAKQGAFPVLLEKILGRSSAASIAGALHSPTSPPRADTPIDSTNASPSAFAPLAQAAGDADAESAVGGTAPRSPVPHASARTPARASARALRQAGALSAVASDKDTAPRHATDPEEASYAQAHEAYFVDRDWDRALRAWDGYLQTYPNGRLALEARYDRALTLVRLGRTAEATGALMPFADAPDGSYRQHEARVLVDAITSSKH